MDKSDSTLKNNANAIKNIFAKPVIDIAKTLTKNKDSLESVLKVVIPEELIEQFKDGTVKLMKSKDGKLLPNIVDENNKILKQIRIEEIHEQLSLSDNIYKLSEYATELKLDAIQEQLDYIVNVLVDIEKSQKNDKYVNNLSTDYYYMKKSILALSELKLSQGMSWSKVQLIINDLNSIDKELESIDIISWLPPKNRENEWQYSLFNENKKEIVLEFNIKKLLEEI